ncbi:amino acid dehydrogenase family protein [Actinidia rufa]|uniref:Amino acid dehydrogenase family protein n=1 Tax=Actinidia rufa TaxID=165716 RepID=A0A7J0F2C3_9ERIC|nr:amino acid dehydrogenase family protein [Actinidia rufa]
MASMIFTDCSSSSTTATRFLPLSRHRVQDGLLHSRRSTPLRFAVTSPSLLRTIAATSRTYASPSVLTGLSMGWRCPVLLVSVKGVIGCLGRGMTKEYVLHLIVDALFSAMAADTSAKIIDGKSVAKKIRDEITAEISRMKDAIGVVPGLAVILVGDRKDSATYVRNKKKACVSVGINSYEVRLPEDSSDQEVLEYISGFNDDPAVHGILVQLPLPSNSVKYAMTSSRIKLWKDLNPNPIGIMKTTVLIVSVFLCQHMNEQNILNAVCIEKDVDGFHPLNIGRLAMRGRDPLFVPCTPKGCIELLHRYGVDIKGKKAVVIGRSNIVGMPAALLLQREDATISIVHSRTKNPEEITRQADIIISAVGKPNMVRGNWIKPGAVVIDVGINPVEDAKSARGYRLVGDVCYEEACKIASAITPVPGGVGPMTIAMLLSNTLSSAKRLHNFK